MFIWRGYGIIGILIPILLAVVSQTVLDHVYWAGYAEVHGNAILAVAMMVSAPLVFFIGRKLNGAPPRWVIDAQTGEPIALVNKHSIFWIPLEWFALALVALGGAQMLGVI